jgi:multiple sugar transport system substrate-binding protein
LTQEIEFSVMSSSATGIQALLDEFESECHIHVRLRLLSWDSAWSALIKVALYNDGPDISEIGSTWLGDLVTMNALDAFDEGDLDALGESSAFLPSAWEGAKLTGQPQVWAIPWVTGARLLFFRRGLLERAGVDEGTAFQNAEQFHRTLASLQGQGIAVPWTIPTGPTHTTLHNVASWVWGAGGDFATADSKRTLFSQAEARAGLAAYFALGRFLSPSVRHLNGLEPDAQFLQNPDTAITMSGLWLPSQAAQELREQLGAGLPPGPSFVGGSHLVIWKHTPKHQAAMQLIQFLMQPSAQITHSQNVGLLPSRLDALAASPFSTNPICRIAIGGLKTGRSFPVTRSWGLMEDRLTIELSTLWDQVLADPGLNLDAAIAKRMEPLAKRLDLVLGQA